MQRLLTLLLVLFISKFNADPGDFRPPAVPLIVFSPHISGKVMSHFFRLERKTGRSETL